MEHYWPYILNNLVYLSVETVSKKIIIKQHMKIHTSYSKIDQKSHLT